MCKEETFPVEEVWGSYHAIARMILPRLKAFKLLDKHGLPVDFDDMESWDNAIQKMIDAFELLSLNHSAFTTEENRTTEQGLDLFRKYFRNLWD